MFITIFAVVLMIVLLLGIPVVFSLGFTSIFVIAIERGIADIPFAAIAQRLIYGINNFPILAIPCFLLAGKLMNEAGVTVRIFRFANSLVGHLPGGLGHANVVASVIFSGMSGSAIGDIVAMGPIEIKAMKEAGFPHKFSVAITAASSLIGPIIPPSIPMVFYGVLAGVSIGSLFIGGIIPGLLMAVSLMVWVYVKAKRHNYPQGELSLAEMWESFKEAFVPLGTPVILIGGIWVGVFTPTEAAAAAVVYVVVMGIGNRSLTLARFIPILRETVRETAILLFILACGSLYGWMMVRLRVPYVLLDLFISTISSPMMVIIILVLFFLFMGCFLSVVVIINITVPIITPILAQYGIDPLYFGVIAIVTLMIGVLTPPFGNVLFALTLISGLSFEDVVKAILPPIIPILVVVVLLILFPPLITFLPKLALGMR
ncbi:MAG: TRAP transporter large permease [candidate division NC10 bacterium]